MTHSGTCLCGGVHITTEAEPVAQLHCQCLHCRQRSGTGHASHMVFTGPVAITGETRAYTLTADSGAEKQHHFCPTCGTPTHVTFPARPALTAVSPGMLHAAEAFAPGFVTYHIRALDWDTLDGALQTFDRLPG